MCQNDLPKDTKGPVSLLCATRLSGDFESKTRARGRNNLILLGPFCSQQGGGAGAVLGAGLGGSRQVQGQQSHPQEDARGPAP